MDGLKKKWWKDGEGAKEDHIQFSFKFELRGR